MQTRFLNLTKRSIIPTFITGALVLTALSCGSLFLPPVGLPEETPNSRATPKGTIELLFRAYENRRIDLFTELLPQNKSFRFFISPEYSLEYAASNANATILPINESQYHYVRAGNYYFWGHDSELTKHRKLFDQAEEIEFTERPYIDDKDFRYRVNEHNDTTHVEVKMTLGKLCIGFRGTDYCTEKNGQMQIFLLEKETDRTSGEKLWVIRDWFDLDYIF